MAKEEEQLLVPLDDYLKAGIHIGTKNKTKYMEPFIYKARPDGLLVLNIQEVNKRLKLLANFISQYNPEDMIIVCRRENGWSSVNLFSKFTGIKAFTGRYPPGILTNMELDTFIETKLIFVVDPWMDKNVVMDAAKIGIPVVALCDTNNDSLNVDLCVPCNNKGKKSLGLIFYIMTREYLKSRKKDFDGKIEDFVEE
ncbi:30S ribosomal protein S2 [Candidatus Woesearchaeota archaeon]|nr:30S ribosomal protein S2 [Candidatus Woesearchaeota archaeon]